MKTAREPFGALLDGFSPVSQMHRIATFGALPMGGRFSYVHGRVLLLC